MDKFLQNFHGRVVKIKNGTYTTPEQVMLNVLQWDTFQGGARPVLVGFRGFMDRLRTKRTLFEFAKMLYHAMSLNYLLWEQLLDIAQLLIDKKDDDEFFQLDFASALQAPPAQEVAMGGVGGVVVVIPGPALAGAGPVAESLEEKVERLKRARDAAEEAYAVAVCDLNDLKEKGRVARANIPVAEKLLGSAQSTLDAFKPVVKVAEDAFAMLKTDNAENALDMVNTLLHNAVRFVSMANDTLGEALESSNDIEEEIKEANKAYDGMEDSADDVKMEYEEALHELIQKRRKM